MAETEPRVGEQRPGGRATRVRTSVLEATSELLMEMGYDQFSVDDVASRAGVHKTTVYRRWPSKAELIADAVRVHSAEHVPIPDTGSLLGDLQALAGSVIANISSDDGSRRSRAIIAAAAHSPDLTASMNSFWAERFAMSVPIIERAVQRGELPPDSDADLIIAALIGPIWVRFLLTGEPIDDDLAHRVAQLIAAGATATTER